jgi:hypothetical protein
MNLAFLVEGRTEFDIYPRWITHLTALTKCTTGYQGVVDNQFTIFNVEGYSKMTKEIPNAIKDISANPVFDYLVIVIDGDNEGIASREAFVNGIINDSTTPTLPINCQLKVIVQNVCIETWFTGHTDHFRAAQNCNDNGIVSFLNQYDVENNDPELMPNYYPPHIVRSIGRYHKTYLQRMLKGVNRRWKYEESTAHTIIDTPYFQRLEQRLTDTPTHLRSFADMVDFLKSL